MFDYSRTSWPKVVCDADNFRGSNPKESLTNEHADCIEKLFLYSGEERILSCLCYGSPDMVARWSGDESIMKLINKSSEINDVCEYGGCYAFQTSKRLVNNGTNMQSQVRCEIWNKNIEFPHRWCEKKFYIELVDRNHPNIKPTTKPVTPNQSIETNHTTVSKNTTVADQSKVPDNSTLSIDTSVSTTDSGQNGTNNATPIFKNTTTKVDNSSVDSNNSICLKEPCRPHHQDQPMSVAVYILCFILISGLLAALFIIAATVCRRQQRFHEMRLNTMKGLRDSAPKIPLPSLPESFERQRTASTMVSSSIGECPEVEVEHIYDTIDPDHDPAYSYAWTVPPIVLKKTRVDVKLVLSPKARLNDRFDRQGSTGGQTSTFSMSTSGTSACQRTYSNTEGSLIENLPPPIPVICCDEPNKDPLAGVLHSTENAARRQMIKSEYISTAVAKELFTSSSSAEAGEVISSVVDESTETDSETDVNVVADPVEQSGH